MKVQFKLHKPGGLLELMPSIQVGIKPFIIKICLFGVCAIIRGRYEWEKAKERRISNGC